MSDPSAKFIAGGTNLIDLMKMDVERPAKVIDITRLPLKQVEATPSGGLIIGALVRNSDLAYDPLIAQRYPVLASAVMAGASQQLRNMASTGGNHESTRRSRYHPASPRTRGEEQIALTQIPESPHRRRRCRPFGRR